MKINTRLARTMSFSALLALSASMALAESVTQSQTTTEQTRTAAGTATKTKTTTTKTDYNTRLASAYKYAGVAEADAVRLREYDTKVLEARRANDTARVKTYYTEQSRILTPEQQTKVRTYLKENPYSGADYEVTTYESYPEPALGARVGATNAGVQVGTNGVRVDTPLGSVGVGAAANPNRTTVVERPVN